MKSVARFLLLLLSSIIILVAIWQYLFCPQLNFKKTAPFSGKNWYNPYAGLSCGNWIKCNFHAHTKAWGGITNGNTMAKDVWRIYQQLGYSVHCISDYQAISTEFSDQYNYIPAYEHGYNIGKIHQEVIGSNAVMWSDYVFPQTLSNKQWVLNRLGEKNHTVIVLNHPEVRDAYTADDLGSLQGYQCMEVMSSVSTSFKEWDAALSFGNPIFIVANDDVHTYSDSSQVGNFCTWVNVSTVDRESVIESLRLGKGYGMRIDSEGLANARERVIKIQKGLPCLKRAEILRDTLFVEFSSVASEIRFIGQNGKLVKSVPGTSTAWYKLDDLDQYVRVGAIFHDGPEIFLNPVFRYSGDPFRARNAVTVNKTKTVIFHLVGIMIIMLWSLLLLRLIAGRSYLNKLSAMLGWKREKEILNSGELSRLYP